MFSQEHYVVNKDKEEHLVFWFSFVCFLFFVFFNKGKIISLHGYTGSAKTLQVISAFNRDYGLLLGIASHFVI